MTVSPTSRFALGLFLSTCHELPNDLQEYLSRPHPKNRNRSSVLYDLGCVLEERLILIVGAQTGVFPQDETLQWLRRDEGVLRELAFDGIGDDARRLPPAIPVDALKDGPIDPTVSALTNFNKALWFRQHEFNRHRSLPTLRKLESALIFGTAEEWTEITDEIAVLRETVSTHDDVGVWLEPVYEVVVLCSDLLETIVGEYLGSSDPWGIRHSVGWGSQTSRGWDGRESEGFESPRIELTHMKRMYDTVVDDIFKAYSGLQTSANTQHKEYLSELLLLQILHVAQIPQSLEQGLGGFERRSVALASMTATELSGAAFLIGASVSWSAPSWRLAPSDKRSQERMRDAIALVANFLSDLPLSSRTDGETTDASPNNVIWWSADR
jgi:hypothetical protein